MDSGDRPYLDELFSLRKEHRLWLLALEHHLGSDDGDSRFQAPATATGPMADAQELALRRALSSAVSAVPGLPEGLQGLVEVLNLEALRDAYYETGLSGVAMTSKVKAKLEPLTRVRIPKTRPIAPVDAIVVRRVLRVAEAIARVEPAPPAGATPHVTVEPREGGRWAVQKAGAKRAWRVVHSKSAAETIGRALAAREHAELVVKGADGTIERRDRPSAGDTRTKHDHPHP